MRVTTFECFEIQIVINVAPVSLSIKKVNFYTCPRLTFLKKNATENAYKSISEPLDFKIFWGACPQTPPAASAFGARNLPRLILKSGYGPDVWPAHAHCTAEIWKKKFSVVCSASNHSSDLPIISPTKVYSTSSSV